MSQVLKLVAGSNVEFETNPSLQTLLIRVIGLDAYTRLAHLAQANSDERGASMVGFDWQVEYDGDNVGAALRVMKNIRQFGDFVGDGVADDSATWLAAAASDAKIIDARGVVSKCLSQVDIKTGQTWLLSGAQLNFAGSSNRLFSAVDKTDFNLVGPFKVTGDLVTNPGEGVTSAAVYVSNCKRFRVIEVTGVNIRGSVIEHVPGANTVPRAEHGVFANPRGDSCVWGFKDAAGTAAEYCTLINPHFTGMAAAGIQTCAGNTTVLGGHLVDNYDGLRVYGGPNASHGIIVGVNCNHNTHFNAHFKDLSNGETVLGCHFYGNGVGVGPIWIENSKGVRIQGGVIDCWVYNDSGGLSGPNYLRDNYCPGGYGGVDIRHVVAGKDQLRVTGNYGAGAYNLAGVSINAAASAWATANRAAGDASAALTSGVAATLLFPTELTNADPQALHDEGTGEWTVPAGEAGWYRFEGNQVFTGTTINAAASFLELQIDTGSGFAAYDLYLPGAAFGGGASLTCQHSSVLYLQAGDKLRLQATITGTGTLTHGRATWRCWASMTRIA